MLRYVHVHVNIDVREKMHVNIHVHVRKRFTRPFYARIHRVLLLLYNIKNFKNRV